MLRQCRSNSAVGPYPIKPSPDRGKDVEEATGGNTCKNLQPQPLIKVGTRSYQSNKIQLREIPGKGKGFVAVQEIMADELIIHDGAILFCEAAGIYWEDVKSVHEAFSQLNDDSKRQILELSDRFMFHGRKSVEGIVFTNYTKAEYSSTWQLFCTYSRLNHSCSPNSRWFSFPTEPGHKSEIVQVFTTCAVAKGEEVCTDYGYDGDAEDWPFQCLCGKCKEALERLQADWLRGSTNESID